MNKVYADAALKSDALKHFEITSAEGQSPLQAARKAAAEVLASVDFPSTKDEEWKYTNVKKLVSKAFNFDLQGTVTEAQLAEAQIEGLEANKLVFVNGQYNEALSNIVEQDKVVVSTLSAAAENNAQLVATHFGKYAVQEEQPFTALNTALAADGVFVHVPRSKVLELPVFILNVVDTTAGDVIAQPRNLIVVEENAQATLIENSITIGENTGFVNAVTEIVVETRAVVDHYKIQTEGENAFHVSTSHTKQADNSNYSNTTITTGGKMIRNNLNIDLGEHCEAYMNGLYFLDGKSHADNHTTVDHQKPNSYSNELYKGLLDGNSTGVFNGKIYVREGAQKTNAFQSNKNILLSEHANVDTKPQLEIWADDVSCSHGCTVGALDEDPLFYLRARGISEEKARALLMFAFAGDVLEKIKVPALKSYIEKIIAARLNYELI
ncbi:Fe-S cluster assembly protein SufD [Limibacter armeniacum]|uniref:Fe-S cluster assembly protein SufD n=1 Tax=Limibacter armeniacum TaxID=466084 RepID=UPI002FE57F46